MIVKLIPVLEVNPMCSEVPSPDDYPYWEHKEIWEKHRQDCLRTEGYTDIFKPYSEGFPFYNLTDISEANLTKIVVDHTGDLLNGAYERKEVCTLFGGYVLNIDGEDKFFPQCCGELSDIFFWEQIAKGKEKAYYEGHPGPGVKINGDLITLNLVEEWEPYQPTPPESILIFSRLELLKAVEEAKEELKTFSERLVQINKAKNLSIDNIEKLLIWENANQK